jgi:hypothetical protein
MLEAVTFTWACNRLLPTQPLEVFCPLGRPLTIASSYSPSRLSANQARPRTMGPDTPTRGVQLPRCRPCLKSTLGMKLVAVECSRSVPESVVMAKAPADPCPYSGE